MNFHYSLHKVYVSIWSPRGGFSISILLKKLKLYIIANRFLKVQKILKHYGYRMATTVPRPVIIDTDAGLDDAWALFMMLAAHNNPNSDVKIEAITCVNGNTTLDNVIKNVARVLQAAKETNIPVFSGAKSTLCIDFLLDKPAFHGKDGFGDAGLPEIEPKLEKEEAYSAIIRMANQFEKGTLSFLALGPLTNLALALRANHEIHDKFKEIMILGGNIHSQGNATICGEFNFAKDPESVRIVLDNFTCPLTIIPLETFQLMYTPRFRTFRDNILAPMQTDQMKLLNVIEKSQLEKRPKLWASADSVAAAIFIEPKIITNSEEFYCTVELNGTFTRGMMVVDKRKVLQFSLPPTATVITDFDLDLFEKIVIAGVGGPYYK